VSGRRAAAVVDAQEHPAPGRIHPVLLLGALFLVSLNLRAAIASVPPLVATIRRDLGLSGVAAGALTTLPVLCMGLFAPPAQRLAARIGRERTVGLAMASLTGGLALRLIGARPTLYLGTFLAGIGIATAGVVLPGVVKEFFADRGGMVSGLYLVAMSAGAAVGAGAAVPVARAVGSWEVSLAAWTVPAAVGLIAWLFVLRVVEPHRGAPAAHGLPWRSRTAWLVSLFIGCQSILFYSELAWLAPAYEDRGWSASRAGLLLALFNIAQLFAALIVPALSDRTPDPRPLIFFVVACSLFGLLTLVVAPESAPWVAVSVLGFGRGGGFGLGLTLLVAYAPDPAASSRLSAMAFLVAYSIAATGPVLLGGLRDLTGSFTVPFLVLIAVDVMQLGLVARLRPGLRVG
jgi:CP family cyanate transporter-like MFS transporter